MTLLGTGVGIGLLGCLFFLAIEVNAGRTILYWLAELILVGVAAATASYARQHSKISSAGTADGAGHISAEVHSKWDHIINACFFIALVAVILRVSRFWWHESSGSWDAWSYWNCRALGIFRSGAEWKVLLGADAPFADYPMLLPSFLAGNWKLLKEDPILLPRIVSVVFGGGLSALLFCALAQLKGLREARLGLLMILATQTIVRWFAAQTADGPYVFFLLSSVISAAFYSVYQRPGFAFLAGLLAGFASFTKNEGLLFLGLVICVAAGWIWQHRQEAETKAIKLFLVGAAVPASMAIFTKITGAHDYLADYPAALFADRTIADVIKLIIFYGSDFGHWVWNPLPLFAVFVLISGWQISPRLKPLATTLLLSCCLTLGAYSMVYLSRLPSYQDIEHNLDRLTSHLLPILTFLIFLVLRRPDEGVSQSDCQPQRVGEIAEPGVN